MTVLPLTIWWPTTELGPTELLKIFLSDKGKGGQNPYIGQAKGGQNTHKHKQNCIPYKLTNIPTGELEKSTTLIRTETVVYNNTVSVPVL